MTRGSRPTTAPSPCSSVSLISSVAAPEIRSQRAETTSRLSRSRSVGRAGSGRAGGGGLFPAPSGVAPDAALRNRAASSSVVVGALLLRVVGTEPFLDGAFSGRGADQVSDRIWRRLRNGVFSPSFPSPFWRLGIARIYGKGRLLPQTSERPWRTGERTVSTVRRRRQGFDPGRPSSSRT